MNSLMVSELKRRVSSSLKAYSDLFFVNDQYFGLVIFCITFININVALAGVWGVLSLHLFDMAIGDKFKVHEKRFLIYNALLVSMGIGYIFKLNVPVLLVVSFLSVSTLLVSLSVESILFKYRLPALSVPFCIIILMVFLSTKSYSNLPYVLNQEYLIETDVSVLSKNLSLLLKSIGAIVFIPNEIVGAVILAGLFFKSWMSFFIVIFGFSVGVGIEEYLTPTHWNVNSLVYAYNFVLISIGLGTVFMLPTFKSLVILPFALFFGIVVNDSLLNVFAVHQIPVFTISFNITTLIYLYALRLIDYKNFPFVYGRKPEDTLDEAIVSEIRNEYSVKINLPFLESMDVYQGFDGEWTHVGDWKHAVDFVIKDDLDKTYSNNQLLLEDYYCFSAPVSSPVSGVVASCRMSHYDNQIGCVDTENNWGNYLMIYSDSGYYILLCHLKQYSSLLEVGSRVTLGEVIALCGNSGYSPEPHLHIHVQLTNILGDKTIPFCFTNYLLDGDLKINHTPVKGDRVIGINNHVLSHVLPYFLDRELTYEFIDLKSNEHKYHTFCIEMDSSSGMFYLVDSSRNKLFVKRKSSSVLFDHFEGDITSPLAFIGSSIPEIPYTFRANMNWNVFIPNKLSLSKFNFALRSLLTFLLYKKSYASCSLKYALKLNQLTFRSVYMGKNTAGSIRLSPSGDIDLIESDRYVLRKVS